MKPLFRTPAGHLGPRPGSLFGDYPHSVHSPHMHQGIDLSCLREPVQAGRPGTVLFAGLSSGLGGNKLVIDHGVLDGQRHVTQMYHFGHKHQPWQECIFVRAGQQISAGQIVGTAGDSGNAVTVHVHLEHLVDGKPQDPIQYLKDFQVIRRFLTKLRLAVLYPSAKGPQGPDVVELQRRLNCHGFYCQTDGIYGPRTQVQVKAFQVAKGLDPDGIVGKLTWQALLKRPML